MVDNMGKYAEQRQDEAGEHIRDTWDDSSENAIHKIDDAAIDARISIPDQLTEKFNEMHEETNDFCDQSVVKVNPPYGLILFICNIFLPGVGTLISSFMGQRFNGLTALFGAI